MDSYLDAMAKNGYERSDLVEGFLAEYAGLSIGPASGGFAEVLAIDPVMAISSTTKSTAQMYEDAVGSALVPIGAAYSGHLHRGHDVDPDLLC
nr:SUKH-3 domain-containing protein [Kribbella voronezhensis]